MESDSDLADQFHDGLPAPYDDLSPECDEVRAFRML
jgi:hypothetical protein